MFGSLPPAGRDLDLLARPDEEQAISNGLSRHGFLRQDRIWARFGHCTAEVVELVPAAAWRLGEAELQGLFDEAVRLEGHSCLVAPAAHHSLLILARKLAWGAELNENRRQRIQAVLDSHPDALEAARRRADAWGAHRALGSLERAMRSNDQLSAAERRRAVAEILAARGLVPIRRGFRPGVRMRRPQRGTLIAFSGLDGSGKSSQATSLEATLNQLGHPAVVEWTSLARHPRVLHAITAAVGWLARLPRRTQAQDGEQRPATSGPTTALRERSGVVNAVWYSLVALSNGLTHRRTVRRHIWRGRTVICDRYVLDSEVHLRYAYGEARGFAFPSALIRLLSPTPDRAYLLDVSGAEATRRKPEYSVEDNQRRARLYREHHEAVGVRRIDGTRRRDDICAEIAEEVWGLLADRR